MDWEAIGDKFGIFGEGLGRKLKTVFGSRNERVVKKLEPLVAEINGLESWAQGLDQEAFLEQTERWKKEVQAGETTLDEILPKAFALVREASVRTLGLRHFDVQLVGGVVLHNGGIAEMMTGEGKTLVATLPLYLNALSGNPPYLVTVNDYLARRDAAWMGPIYRYLGLSCGAIQSNMPPAERHPVYAGDIVYGTNNEFGFDYLRDNMKNRTEDQVQKVLSFAIVDEVDSILIDEARTPLIISGPVSESSDKYKGADMVARKLKLDEHFEVKEKEKSVSLLEEGIEQAEKLLGVESFYTAGNMDWPHYIENALRAHHIYQRDQEYVVEQGEVIIVDEFTGRKMNGRRWSDGLHQAVETREGLQIRRENQTLATITLQNYFRLYDKLAGMTGTAMTEAEEFHKIYGLDVLSIPTNLPLARNDEVDVVYRTEPEKWKAIADEIEEVHERGQPVLVGTTSVENSEKLAGILSKRGVPHEVLNAKVGQQEREAHIVAKAGERGAVTVSTNMAGRGTDIKLGGNFEHRLGIVLKERGLVEGDPEHLEEIDRIREEVRDRCARDEAEVLEFGGLYVLGTERHESRRVDNQLRGRAGRQGDVGLSRFFLSLQDPLMRRFYRDWVTNAMERLGMSEGVPIESKMVTRAIEKAQKKVEDYYFEIRKNLLEYDEVMDEQRKTIYVVRQEVLEGKETREKVETMLEAFVRRNAQVYADDVEGFQGWWQRSFGFEIADEIAEAATAKEAEVDAALERLRGVYDEREEALGAELMRQLERFLLLRTIDGKWMDHLRAVDALRAGIGLRGYAQKDPKNEYKQEGFELFQKLLEAVEDEISSLVLRVEVRRPAEGAPAQGAFARPPQVYGEGQARHPSAGGVAAPPRPPGRRPPTRVPAAMAFDRARHVRARAEAAEAARRKQEGDADAGATPEAAASQGAPPAAKAPAVGTPAPDAPKDGAASGGVPGPDAVPEVGRNEPCPCGSGKKYKKCHGKAG